MSRPGQILAQLRARIWPRQADVPPLILKQSRIYILPTRAGLAYAATLLLMLLASINYNLSLGYALTFLLSGLGVVTIVHTFRNLVDLQLSPSHSTPGFAGELAYFGLLLSATRTRHAIQLRSPGQPTQPCEVQQQYIASLPVSAERRGWQPMPRLTISTTWPLGLVRAWSYARFSDKVLVYPAPALQAPPHAAPPGGEGRLIQPEPEDFHGLRSHQPGDLLQHVAWKTSARLDDGLLTKQFAATVGEAACFDLDQTPDTGIEERLSILCRWIIDADAAGHHYALKLGTRRIGPASGPEHRHQCLQALALYV